MIRDVTAEYFSQHSQHTVGRSNPLAKRFGSPVMLNVYDLAIDGKPLKSLNGIALKLGFGAFHSGIEVFGKEISYSYDRMSSCLFFRHLPVDH